VTKVPPTNRDGIEYGMIYLGKIDAGIVQIREDEVRGYKVADGSTM
jgi:hypothetical protein